MALATRLQPPANESPVADDGLQHTGAWRAYFQSVADQLNILHNGVTDGSDAGAGQIGEYMTASGSGVVLATGTPAAVASLSLTAGDWQVSGYVFFTPSGAAHATRCGVGVDTGMAITGTDIVTTFATGVGTQLGAGPRRFSVSATTAVHLAAVSAFTGGTMSAAGTISARRMR